MANFWGRIDILVNNAGLGLPALIEEGGSRHLRRQFETNVFGALDVATATIPFIRESKSGCIVTIGSRSVWKPDIPGLGPYAASKAALHGIGFLFITLKLRPPNPLARSCNRIPHG
jgi:NAD(P)-dependent dehydrogenase (short-subunit alcohol dehydrogenase family)